MIELNLLPDVKMEYLKAQRSRRLIASVSIIVSLACIGLLVLLLMVTLAQNKHLSDLNADIKTDSQTLKDKPGIDKVLTVQNQLERLTELHSSKPAGPRMFEYLNQVTPTGANINNIQVDFTQQQIIITGTADALSTVNKYVDTLKYTKFTVGDSEDTNRAFNDVVLTSFGVNTATSQGSQAQPATYTITLKYNPKIFDNTQKIKLEVPTLTTTRSALSNSDLFQAAPAKNKGN